MILTGGSLAAGRVQALLSPAFGDRPGHLQGVVDAGTGGPVRA